MSKTRKSPELVSGRETSKNSREVLVILRGGIFDGYVTSVHPLIWTILCNAGKFIDERVSVFGYVPTGERDEQGLLVLSKEWKPSR